MARSPYRMLRKLNMWLPAIFGVMLLAMTGIVLYLMWLLMEGQR
jgi:hypothetical protein